MLLSACFSDVTNHAGCDELRTSNIKYYGIDKYTDKGRQLIEAQFDKRLVITASTIGYTIYKRRIDYSFGNYNFKLTSIDMSGSVKWSL